MPQVFLSHLVSPSILLGCAALGSVAVWAHAPVHLEHLPRSNPGRRISQPPRQGLHPASGCSRPRSLPPPSAASVLFADAIGLQPDARGVATSLGLNERLFVVNPQEVHELVGTGRVPGHREALCFRGGGDRCWGRSQRGERGPGLPAAGP